MARTIGAVSDETGKPADPTQDAGAPPQPKTFRFSRTLSNVTPPADVDVSRARAHERRWQWHWPAREDTVRPDGAEGGQAGDVLDEPSVTYYEMLTGRRDRHRSYFVAARRVAKVITWTLVLGLPALLVTVGILTGQSLETIFFMGIFALIIGVMFQRSLRLTPFD